jgi:opacity protein-like surface antigen
MKRLSWLVLTAAVLLGASSAEAQSGRYARFEIVPLAGYVWGGSYHLDASTGGIIHPSGDLKIDDSFGYGIMLDFLAARGTALELSYLRQDTKLRFDPSGSAGPTGPSADFATNYIHLGGRQEFGHNPKIKPFINGSFGVTVFDVKESGIGTSTDFSLAIGGGFQSMFGKEQRFGLRGSIKGWFSFVPSDDYFYWCDFYGCGVSQGSETVSQGEVTGGLVIRF